MKSTDMDRRDRELRRSQKKIDVLNRKQSNKSEITVGGYIDRLHDSFFYDEEKIYNIKDNVDMLAFIEEMKENIPDKDWETVFRKALRKTKIKQKEHAFKELKFLLTI